MKILVTTRLLDTWSTSEGTCTVKFCDLLSERGHEVLCLNGDDSLPPGPLAWLPECTIIALAGAPPEPVSVLGERWPRRLARLVDQKADAARAYATGFSRAQRVARRRWRDGLTAAIAAHRPDVVFIRGAGQDFSPHLAMTELAERAAGTGPAWVAHYHDPWPLSLYPEPYARREGSIGWFQERANRRILRAAGAVTFPSRRLADWEASLAGVALGERAVVVPHQGVGADLWAAVSAITPPAPAPDDQLTLVHAGLLNRQRDPQPLRDALARRLARRAGDGARSDVHLRLLGSLDPKLTGTDRWAESVEHLQARGALELDDRRVSYAESIAAVRHADVGVVVAVGHPESPFFPAKLADLVSLGGPLLVLAPTASSPADIIGLDHPGFAAIDRPDEIDRALDALVDARRLGTLDRFTPPVAAVRLVSPDGVGAAIDRAIERARWTAGVGSRP